MEFNFIIFPSPKLSPSLLAEYESDLIFIPKHNKHVTKDCCSHIPEYTYIPCLFLPSLSSVLSKNFCIYFHGNAEDILISRDIADYLRSNINMNILVVEYPGYSLYEEEKNCYKVLEDSLVVFDYLKDTLKISENNIYVIGRSIGTSPAIYLSSKRKPAGMCLMSPYTSIRAVVEHKGGLFQYFVSDLFRNEDYIKSVTCPILFIHGQQDSLIPYEHTIKLKDNCSCPYDIIMPEQMNHNQFDYDNDFIQPLKDFLRRHTSFNSSDTMKYVFPTSFYEIPPQIQLMIENQKKNAKYKKF